MHLHPDHLPYATSPGGITVTPLQSRGHVNNQVNGADRCDAVAPELFDINPEADAVDAGLTPVCGGVSGYRMGVR